MKVHKEDMPKNVLRPKTNYTNETSVC